MIDRARAGGRARGDEPSWSGCRTGGQTGKHLAWRRRGRRLAPRAAMVHRDPLGIPKSPSFHSGLDLAAVAAAAAAGRPSPPVAPAAAAAAHPQVAASAVPAKGSPPTSSPPPPPPMPPTPLPLLLGTCAYNIALQSAPSVSTPRRDIYHHFLLNPFLVYYSFAPVKYSPVIRENVLALVMKYRFFLTVSHGCPTGVFL